mmetsp:Transcript_91202/g.244208  ORF Transcript_91202/g.244208 Transcript_91202/m.244208 type:complete len:354 (+) Transcript_91202:49-1110(+)
MGRLEQDSAMGIVFMVSTFQIGALIVALVNIPWVACSIAGDSSFMQWGMHAVWLGQNEVDFEDLQKWLRIINSNMDDLSLWAVMCIIAISASLAAKVAANIFGALSAFMRKEQLWTGCAVFLITDAILQFCAMGAFVLGYQRLLSNLRISSVFAVLAKNAIDLGILGSVSSVFVNCRYQEYSAGFYILLVSMFVSLVVSIVVGGCTSRRAPRKADDRLAMTQLTAFPGGWAGPRPSRPHARQPEFMPPRVDSYSSGSSAYSSAPYGGPPGPAQGYGWAPPRQSAGGPPSGGLGYGQPYSPAAGGGYGGYGVGGQQASAGYAGGYGGGGYSYGGQPSGQGGYAGKDYGQYGGYR